MIKFFRKIRYNLMETGKTGKYFKYAIGEIILVVIGILIALSINNWNESRKTDAEEIKMLKNIKKALTSDIENQIEFHIERAQAGNESLELILDYIINKRPYNDSLKKHFPVLSIAGRITWTPQLTAYKRLESKGIEIIKKDELLEAILNIYNLDYPRILLTFDNYKRNIYEYGRPFARRKFKEDGFETEGSVLIPINYELLFDDVEFYNTIRVLLGNNRTIYGRLTEIKGNLEQVIKMIDEELQQRN